MPRIARSAESTKGLRIPASWVTGCSGILRLRAGSVVLAPGSASDPKLGREYSTSAKTEAEGPTARKPIKGGETPMGKNTPCLAIACGRVVPAHKIPQSHYSPESIRKALWHPLRHTISLSATNNSRTDSLMPHHTSRSSAAFTVCIWSSCLLSNCVKRACDGRQSRR